MVVLYIVFILSVFFPIYTYALYPVVLRLLPSKVHKRECIEPSVSVMIVGEDADDKIKNIKQCKYPNLEIIVGDYTSKAKGEIIVFTDTKTKLDLSSVEEIVKPFADDRIGCVVGQLTNPKENSFFWKYENCIKKLESKIGCTSGANESLFAIRSSLLPFVCDSVINKPFYIATKIYENGKDVVFTDLSKAYENSVDGWNFEKHVLDAAGYWQAIKAFKHLLFFQRGSFVFLSHRVMKCFVWLNMLALLVSSFLLSFDSLIMFYVFLFQVMIYTMLFFMRDISNKGVIGKIITIIQYFVLLNISYLLGLFHKEGKK